MAWKSLEGYFAILEDNGAIVADMARLHDPASRSVVVIAFAIGTRYFHGIFHQDLDAWEIVQRLDDESQKSCGLANRGTRLFDHCEIVAAKNVNDLFKGPQDAIMSDRLAEAMRKELMRDLDSGVIASLNQAVARRQIAATLPSITLQPQPGRKLKAVWTVEAQQDLRAMLGAQPVRSFRFAGKLPAIDIL